VRTLRHVAAAINADPSLGLSAAVEKSWASTDSRIAGTRFRRPGKGRNGLKLTVRLVRTGEVVCQVDTSQSYQFTGEAIQWLQDWRDGRRVYHRVRLGGPVPGESQKRPRRRRS